MKPTLTSGFSSRTRNIGKNKQKGYVFKTKWDLMKHRKMKKLKLTPGFFRPQSSDQELWWHWFRLTLCALGFVSFGGKQRHRAPIFGFVL